MPHDQGGPVLRNIGLGLADVGVIGGGLNDALRREGSSLGGKGVK